MGKILEEGRLGKIFGLLVILHSVSAKEGNVRCGIKWRGNAEDRR